MHTTIAEIMDRIDRLPMHEIDRAHARVKLAQAARLVDLISEACDWGLRQRRSLTTTAPRPARLGA